MERKKGVNIGETSVLSQGPIIKSIRLRFQQERKHRTRDEIKAEILQSTLEGALQTQIMYRCNLSYIQLRDYLKRLTESGLLEKTKIKLQIPPHKKNKEYEFFITTEKGKKWLNLYQKLRTLEG